MGLLNGVWESCESCINNLISNIVSNHVDKPEFLFNALDCLVNCLIWTLVVPTSVLCNDFTTTLLTKSLLFNQYSFKLLLNPLILRSPAVFDQFEPTFTVLTVRCSLWNAAHRQLLTVFLLSRLKRLLIQTDLLFFSSAIHACFGSGRFPTPFKHTIVRPLLEMPNLTVLQLQAYLQTALPTGESYFIQLQSLSISWWP